MPNGPDMAVAFLAVASSATCAPLNPSYRASEYEFYLGDLGATALVTCPVSPDEPPHPSVGVAADLGISVIELAPDSVGGLRANGASPPVNVPAVAERPVGAEDIALVLHTSGTTSRPKLVPLTHSNLTASAGHIGESLRLTGSDRCLNVMPLFHIHGLVAALLSSIRVGASIVCSPGFVVTRFFEWFDRHRPTWYTAVPTMHQAVLKRAEHHRAEVERSQLRFVRSSSSSLAPQVNRELRELFGVPVIEAYGMTEAAHQIASNPLPPGVSKPGSVGPPAGPSVAIFEEDGTRRLDDGSIGEVVIAGPNVTSGYLENAEANRTSFVDGWFRTGDQGYLDEDGYLHLTGRLKELINRGGEKIAPREVDEVLLQHPERLADFKVPATVVILDEIPKGATGKLQRIGFAERLALTDSTGPQPSTRALGASASTGELSHTEQLVARVWQRVLEIDSFGLDDPFVDVGGDSILAVKLASELKQELDVDFAVVEFFDAPTVRTQAAFVDGLSGESGEAPTAPPE